MGQQDKKTALRPVTPSTILSKKLLDLKSLLLNTKSDEETLALINECCDLIVPLDSYLESQATSPSAALIALEKETNKQDWDSAFAKAETQLPLEREMLSGAVEGQFLKMLASMTKAERVLEIGSFTSYASLAIAEGLPENGVVIACEVDPYTAQFAREQVDKSAQGKKIEIKIGDALDSIKDLDTSLPFDLVFLDADKTGYLKYYNAILEHNLLPVGGIICVDNSLFMGQAYNAGVVNNNGKAIQEFNDAVVRDNRVEQVLIPLRDGITIIRRIK